MIRCLLFYLLLLCSLDWIHTASFSLNAGTSTQKSAKKDDSSTKKNILESSSTYDDAQEKDSETDDEMYDDFDDDLEYSTSLKTKLVRSLRSIKKYSTVLIAGLSVCVVGYVYWYKIWPFAPRTQAQANHSPQQSNVTSAVDKDENLVDENRQSKVSGHTKNSTEKDAEEYTMNSQQEPINKPIHIKDIIFEQKASSSYEDSQEVIPAHVLKPNEELAQFITSLEE